MNKKLSKVLSLILVLCMIPATVITAFARGKGVYNSGRDNQSIDNAYGQPIPETIVVDGYLNDTGWAADLWNYVDSSTGHWNTKTLAGNNGDATYKYQLRADLEQLYFGASVLLPKDVTEGVIMLWFKEEGHTDNNGGVAKGYTDHIILEFDAKGDGDPVVTSTVTDPYNRGDGKSTLDNALPAQISKFIGKKSIVDGRIAVDLEFNNLLGHIFETNLNNVSYFVSLELKNGGTNSNNKPTYDKLYHPKYYHTENANLPTAEYWPTDASGKAGGAHLDTSLISATAPKSEITVDGNFNEAIWDSLVDENGNYESLSGDTTYGTGVQKNDNVFFVTEGENTGFDSSYNSNDPDGNRRHMRFKYEVRVDGDYLYGAVVAYVPPIKSYTVDGKVVNTSPDLTVNFFDDERCQYPEGFVPGQGEVTEQTQSSKFSGYQPEALLQVRSQYSQYIEGDATYGNVFYTFANIWPEAENAQGHLDKVGWGSGFLDNTKPEQLSATRVAREGNLWNFEFRILLSAVPVDSNGDIAFSIAVYDRYYEDADSRERFLAYTGVVASGESYGTYVPQYDYSRNQKNIISAAKIASAKDLEIANNYDFSDGVLDQNLWTALSAADDYVDGRERKNAQSPATSFAYKFTADHEFLYGAMILKADSWTTNDLIRIWANRKKTDTETETELVNGSAELDIKSYSGHQYDQNNTYLDYSTVLKDGVKDETANYGPGDRGNGHMFAAYYPSTPLVFELSELYSVNKITLYMSGGNHTTDRRGQWGIYVANGFKVEYSEDGVTYKSVDNLLSQSKRLAEDVGSEKGTNTDGTTYETWLDAWQFDLTWSGYATARYIKITVTPIAQDFCWLSEVDFFGTEAHGMYYALSMKPEEEGQRFISCNKNYLDGHNANKPNELVEDGSFDYAVTKIDANTRAVEFRVSLETLGIKYDLTAPPEEELFYYYVSVDRGDDSGLIYPRNNTGRTPHQDDKKNWLMDEVYDGALKFSYADMQNAITVDGKLDERLWLGDDVIMEHVDSTKGTWASQPKYGNSLEYDYIIYAGTNYLYGAAIIDESAIVSKESYKYTDIPQTRFEIWIDNGIDEAAWMTDSNDKTNIVVNSKLKDLPVDDKGVVTNGMNGDRQWDVSYYLNYYYNIYLVDQATIVPSAVGDKYVCGGTAPMYYNDPEKSLGDDDLSVAIGRKNWNWGMTTVNGKTYVEFIIDLDNFYCDRSKGLNYYVSVTHAYGTETETTADDEILSLYSPKIGDDVGNTSPLWITHINTTYPEGGGVIFTKEFLDTYDGTTSYWGEDALTWWTFIIFTPVDASNNKYKVKAIRDGYGDNKYGAPFRNTDLSAGDFVYGFNQGNDWIYYKQHPDKAGSTDPSTKANINYTNSDAIAYHNWARKLRVDDVIKFNFDENVRLTGSTATSDDGPLATQTAYNYKAVAGAGATTSVKWYEPAYICKSSATIIEKAPARINAEKNEYLMQAPTTGTWYAGSAGKIELLTHFLPESIKIDGELNEPAWDNDRWISVVENANGTLKGQTALDGTDICANWLYQYQLRTDGEFLYVGVKYNGVVYEQQKPHFTLWLKTDSASETWTHFYSIGHIDNNGGISNLYESDFDFGYPLMDGKELEIIGPVGAVNSTDGQLHYKNMLNFVENTSKLAVGATESNYEYRNEYNASPFFGYTEEIQENATSGEYYPDIRTTKLVLGNECATMQNSANNNGHTVVEFKVSLAEFGGENGFEYFVEGQFGDFDLIYPMCYTESASNDVRYQAKLPMWNWSEHVSEKVTVADIQSGEMRMRNNAMPVVTLGAKISDKYVPSVGSGEYKAIRMGAVYNEDYLRNWRKEDAIKLDPSDELYTAPVNDYWDVADLGIVMLPTQLLGADEQLTLETPSVVALSADNIIKWINDAETGGWSNFADYENFVFYATLYGLPSDDIKVSFCGYVDFYASTGTDSYYDKTLVRSYNMIKYAVGDADWIPEN